MFAFDLACSKLWLPFRAPFALATCDNAFSTAALSKFDPLFLFKIFSAFATA
ncbi:Uncharacterised protein [Staphylococcus aureus]|nr:Uncharacterised protein [Staphylococcus aureus]